jgi:hypothetical protein
MLDVWGAQRKTFNVSIFAAADEEIHVLILLVSNGATDLESPCRREDDETAYAVTVGEHGVGGQDGVRLRCW